MIRNGTTVWIYYVAWDSANNKPALLDAANHTLKYVLDGVVADPLNLPEEIGGGVYRVRMDDVESATVKFIALGGVSASADVYLIPALVITDLLVPGVEFVACYTAWDTFNNVPATVDDINHSIIYAKDNASAAATNAPVEISAVNLPGLYKLTVTALENTGKAAAVLGTSLTSNVNIMPTIMNMFVVDYPSAEDVRIGTDYAEGAYTGTLVSFAATYELPQEPVYESAEIIILEGCEP